MHHTHTPRSVLRWKWCLLHSLCLLLINVQTHSSPQACSLLVWSLHVLSLRGFSPSKTTAHWCECEYLRLLLYDSPLIDWWLCMLLLWKAEIRFSACDDRMLSRNGWVDLCAKGLELVEKMGKIHTEVICNYWELYRNAFHLFGKN